ncbi:hypothetical protein [Sphingomonas sp. PP-CC-3G-468]|uniref:hypothetical protein n=1 Tax=Sphingomonas sp. PP-CC-3G-468 TaxID=2135656 RepID=UPI00104ED9D8|nr:hypothetical protein [Sphingomonas sp. PP-CC-3G-468]TCM04761.1 hypothetical protein C8J41_10857 [Sphingomonas sp. PP-CC-3G-468]
MLAVTLASMAGGAGGAVMLRHAWADRARERPVLVAAGWVMLLATVLLAAWSIGPVKGMAVGVAAIGIGALGVVVQGRVSRAARASRDSLAPEPLEGPSRAWRGWMKFLLAGPLGMTAAMGVAFCYAAWAPGDPRTRIIIGGLLMPVAWALAMTWTLADQRLLRALGVLVGTTVAGFALAAMRGLA